MIKIKNIRQMKCCLSESPALANPANCHLFFDDLFLPHKPAVCVEQRDGVTLLVSLLSS